MSWPSTVSSFTNPQPTDRLNNPSHSSIETAQNTNLTAIQTFIGVEGASSTVGTLIYDIRSPGSNGGGHVQTANKGGTGQTTFTKGDILVAQSASVLSKLAVGASGQALYADPTQQLGVRWGGSSSVVCGVSSTLVYVKSLTANYVIVTAIGAGGSGGCGNAVNAGYGGGGGAYNQQIIPAGNLPSSVLVVVGAGGASQAGFNTPGSGGGNTTFGTNIIIAGGGGPGGTSSSGTAGTAGSVAGIYSILGISGGVGATNSGVDTPGSGGGAGASGATTSVAGRNSSLNGNGGLGTPNTAGNPGSVYGGGGSGSPAGSVSGAGAPGYISIVEF